jgi:hypothetical protein
MCCPVNEVAADFAGSLRHRHSARVCERLDLRRLYGFVALLWLIPDPRIERELEKREE